MTYIKINNCDECQDCDIIRHYTPDSFEYVMKWLCKKDNNKLIGYVETFDPKPVVPEWCPRNK